MAGGRHRAAGHRGGGPLGQLGPQGISDRDPAGYWLAEVAKKHHLGADRLARQRYWRALPDGREGTAYQEFLASRRPLLARVVRDVLVLLCDPAYAPEYPAPAEPEPVATGRAHYGVSIGDLIGTGLLEAGGWRHPHQRR